MDPPHRDKSVDVGMNIGPAIRTTSTGSFTPRVSNHDEFPDVRRICRFLGHMVALESTPCTPLDLGRQAAETLLA
jgi:hypothetical protein